MFIGRKPDGTIYGAWTSKQPNDKDHPGIEEVADDHPDLVAFLNRPMPVARSVAAELVEQIKADPEALAALKEELSK